MRSAVVWVPLALFAALAAMFAFGLKRGDDAVIASRVVGQPVPSFALAPAVPTHPGLASADLARGRPRLVNIFASWCVPCAAESPQLLALRRAGVAIDGIAIRDRAEDVAAFLTRRGDPYMRIGADPESRAQIALGSSGVPETFVVDGRGVIRAQHVGDIRSEDVADLIAMLRSLR